MAFGVFMGINRYRSYEYTLSNGKKISIIQNLDIFGDNYRVDNDRGESEHTLWFPSIPALISYVEKNLDDESENSCNHSDVLPTALMSFLLNTCFHINIHAAHSLLDFFIDLSKGNHKFIRSLNNGANLAFIDYCYDEQIERLTARISYAYWVLILDKEGWSIKEAS